MPTITIPTGLEINAANFSETERLLILRFYDETGFRNPLGPILGRVRETCTAAAAILTTAAALPDPVPGYEPITAIQLGTLATQITTLGTTSVPNYLTHSNRLTGVTFDSSADPPDLSGLLGMAVGYNSAKESLRAPEDPIVDNFSPIFGSILGPAEELCEEIISTLSNIRNQLGAGNRLANYTRILQFVNRSITRFAEFIVDDNDAYDTAFTFMTKYGTAVALNSLLTTDDWGHELGKNIGDSNTVASILTIREEKSLSDTLSPSGYTGSAQDLIEPSV